jgi:hypothetical protein
MTTFADWDKEVEGQSEENLRKYQDALETLMGWDFFKAAYNGYGLPSVKNILAVELNNRPQRKLKEAREKTKLTDKQLQILLSDRRYEMAEDEAFLFADILIPLHGANEIRSMKSLENKGLGKITVKQPFDNWFFRPAHGVQRLAKEQNEGRHYVDRPI